MQLFSIDERAAIEDAISRAEKKTSGEIVVVVTSASARYYATGVMWAALVALGVPLPLIWFTRWPAEYIFVAQLALFALGLALILWEPFRFALVPKLVKRARAHERAVEQFLAQDLYTTKSRTGVLIYVSLAERFAGVIADNAIYEKVPRETWEQIARELTHHLSRGERDAGLIGAIKACGKLLAKHYPPRRHDANELPNHLIVLDIPGWKV
jgi:putative membrane protein